MKFHDFIQDGNGWGLLEDTELWANPFAAVHAVKVQTPTRPQGAIWTVLHRKGACVVAPITREGNVVLVRQERIPIRATIWEFPAGQIDANHDHTPDVVCAAALRELREESGYELSPEGRLIPLGLFFPSAGITDEHCHLFAARPVIPSPHGSSHDAQEAITECREFTEAEFRTMIANGEIRDANTLSAFARMCAMNIM